MDTEKIGINITHALVAILFGSIVGFIIFKIGKRVLGD